MIGKQKRRAPRSVQAGRAEALGALDFALRYAAMGIRVIWIPPGSKAPVMKAWPNAATTERTVIEQWALDHPGCNFGLVMGDGFVAIDIDDPGKYPELKTLGLDLPPTRKHRTAKGLHLIYGVPPGVTIRNTVKKFGIVDVRHANAQVVAPGSVHPSGFVYEIAEDLPIAQLPDQSLRMLMEPEGRPVPQPATPLTPGSIPEGTRDQTLFKIGCSLRAKGASEAEILAALRVRNQEQCKPPLEDAIVQEKARSAAKYAPGEAAKVATIVNDAPWPEPEGFGQPEPAVERITPQMLPVAIRDWCVDEANRMQGHFDFAAAGAIGALGIAVQRRARVRPKRNDTGWVEYPNLWTLFIARPAEKKSPLLRSMTRPLREIEEEWRKEHESAFAEHFINHERAKIEKAEWKKEAAQAVRDKKPLPPRPASVPDEPPARRRLLTHDATFEALHMQLVQQPAGLGLIRDELMGWLSQLGKQGREGEQQFFMQGWDGESSYTADRVGRGTVHVPHVCLSVIGTTQPGPLRQYFADAMRGGASHDGFIARFPLSLYPDPRPAVWTDRVPNEAARQKAFAVFRTLANLPSDRPLDLQFDDEAQQRFSEWWTDHNAKTQSPDLPPALAAHFSKYQKLVPALSLLFALCDGCRELISVSHLRMAIEWARVLATHAYRIYSAIVPREVEAARSLARRLQSGWKAAEGAFTARDVYRSDWAHLSTPEEVRSALAVLESYCWVRKDRSGDGTGRPSERYQRNPKITETYPDIDGQRRPILAGSGGLSVAMPAPASAENQSSPEEERIRQRDKTRQKIRPPENRSATGGRSARRRMKFTREGRAAISRTQYTPPNGVPIQ